MTLSAVRKRRLGIAAAVLLAHAALLYMAWIVRLQLAASDESVLTTIFINRPVLVPLPPQVPPTAGTAELRIPQAPAVPALSSLPSFVLPDIGAPAPPGASISLSFGAQFDCTPRAQDLTAEQQLRCRDLFRAPGESPTVYVYTAREESLRTEWAAELAPPIAPIESPAATLFKPCTWINRLCWPTPFPYFGLARNEIQERFGVSQDFDLGNGFALEAGAYTNADSFQAEYVVGVRVAYRW
jgi:hypothetical protein